jgi:hypothetical protein
MPVYPRAEQNRELTTQQPSVMAAKDSSASQALEGASKLGLQVQDFAVEWQKGQDDIQTVIADSKFKTGMAEINARAEQDQDFYNSESYFREIDNLKKESLAGISGQVARDASSISLTQQADMGKIALGGMFKQKQITEGRLAAGNTMASYSENGNVEGLKEYVSGLKKTQLFSEAELTQLEDKHSKTANWNNFLISLSNDIDGTEADLDKFGLTKKQMVDAEPVIEKAKKEFHADVKKLQAQNGKEYMISVLDGHFPDPEEVDELIARGAAGDPEGLDPTTGAAITKYLKSDRYEADKAERDALFYMIPEQYFDIDKDGDSIIDIDARFESIVGYRKAVFDAYDAGAISESMMKEKIAESEESFDQGISETANKFYKNGQKSWRFFKTFWKKHNKFQVKTPDGKQNFSLTQEEVDEAMGKVGDELMRLVKEKRIEDDKVQEVTQRILHEYMVQKIPELANIIGTPSAIITGDDLVEMGESTVQPTKKRTPSEALYKNSIEGDVISINHSLYRIIKASPDGDHDVEKI